MKAQDGEVGRARHIALRDVALELDGWLVCSLWVKSDDHSTSQGVPCTVHDVVGNCAYHLVTLNFRNEGCADVPTVSLAHKQVAGGVQGLRE